MKGKEVGLLKYSLTLQTSVTKKVPIRKGDSPDTRLWGSGTANSFIDIRPHKAGALAFPTLGQGYLVYGRAPTEAWMTKDL